MFTNKCFQRDVEALFYGTVINNYNIALLLHTLLINFFMKTIFFIILRTKDFFANWGVFWQ